LRDSQPLGFGALPRSTNTPSGRICDPSVATLAGEKEKLRRGLEELHLSILNCTTRAVERGITAGPWANPFPPPIRTTAPLAHLIARAAKTSQICLTTHAEALAAAITHLTGTPAIHLEKVDGETRVAREDS